MRTPYVRIWPRRTGARVDLATGMVCLDADKGCESVGNVHDEYLGIPDLCGGWRSPSRGKRHSGVGEVKRGQLLLSCHGGVPLYPGSRQHLSGDLFQQGPHRGCGATTPLEDLTHIGLAAPVRPVARICIPHPSRSRVPERANRQQVNWVRRGRRCVSTTSPAPASFR